ncbi:MAG: Gfo/Idh/MocA family protein [Kiritimatiellia bacterium]|jgi:hypothetical protein
MSKNNYNRKDFLKQSGITGTGLTSCSSNTEKPKTQNRAQTFNMSGFVAPKLDVVRVAVIGLGDRGPGTVRRLATIEGVEIKALCDLEADRVSKTVESIKHLGHTPDSYSGGENEWKKICERSDIDLIAVVTPWRLHTPICVYAMENGKHTYTELPAALTIDECWQLVETSERTRKYCVQMSGNCHSGTSAVVLNMARKGYFGDIIHGEGAYIHDLTRYLFDKEMYHNMWRLKENTNRSGCLYPQHGLVPIIQMMDINYGDKMDYLTSISSNDFTMAKTAGELALNDDFFKPCVGKNYNGNINITTIRTNNGRTIMIQHDVTSPRPNVRFSLISGTKAIYKAPDKIATSHAGWLPDEEFKALIEKYTPEITKRFDELTKQAKQIDNRGYYKVMPTDWRLIDCLRNGLPMDMDVYEAAVSSAIIPLSIESVANRSNSVDVPDFTCGSWKTNPRGMDINLERGGGTTKLL